MLKEWFPALSHLLFALVFIGTAECQAQHMNAPNAPCRNAGLNSAITQCFLQESRKANDHLNALYGKIINALDRDEAQQLKVVQRIWLQFREANCEAERRLYAGGSAAPTAHAACVAADTEERTEELQTMYSWRLEK